MTANSDDPTWNPNRALPAWYAAHRVNDRNDHLIRQGFPTVKQLRQGILLGCIADALYLAANEGSFEGHYWDGDTYIDDNQQGETWAVAFTPEGAVAVFYSTESERNPFPPGSPPYDQAIYFRGMPDALRTAKERALAYMINLEWVAGGPNAVVTAAMWADGERFTANEPWEAVFHNSLWACYQQLLPLDVALVEWQNEFDLADDDLPVVHALYQRRVASTEAMIPVEPWEREAFTRKGDISGLLAARDALANVGIALTIDE